jgi:hypothetical protein
MWSENHEKYLQSIAERCASREVMHLTYHRRLSKQCAWFKVPTIFISLICGSAQASQASLEALINSPSFNPWLPIILGLFSLFVSLLNSVSSYLQVESLCQQHLSSSILFGKLCRQIARELRLQPKERSLTGKDAIKTYSLQFDQLQEQAPPLCRRIEKEFSKRRDTKKLKLSLPPSIRIDPILTYGQSPPPMKRGRSFFKRDPPLEEIQEMGRVRKLSARFNGDDTTSTESPSSDDV